MPKRRFGLTELQTETAEYVVQGLTNSEIATKMGVSTSMINSRLTRVYAKVGVPNRAGLVAVWAKS